jgi:hypothetical protein
MIIFSSDNLAFSVRSVTSSSLSSTRRCTHDRHTPTSAPHFLLIRLKDSHFIDMKDQASYQLLVGEL